MLCLIALIKFCLIGNDRVLEGQAAYRLGQAYDKIGEGETALQVGIF